jgi:hypothetical protein
MCVNPDLIRDPIKKLRALLTYLIGFASCLRRRSQGGDNPVNSFEPHSAQYMKAPDFALGDGA